MRRITSLFVLLLSTGVSLARPVTAATDGYTGADNLASGCATLEFMAKMLAVNILLPDPGDSLSRLNDMQYNLRELNRVACQQVLHSEYTRFGNSYPNGRLVSEDLYYEPWYFPNGQLFMAGPARDTAIYYPDGGVMSWHWTHGDEALYWPRGYLATNGFRRAGETWFYPDGQIITYNAGYAGERWFYPFPRLDGRLGQELISNDWGVEEADFSYLNFDYYGDLFVTRERIRRKLILSDEELLDVPGVLLMVTRLYGTDDEARQFIPADANIAGAPY
jgi:hypothetical protein